MLVEIKRSKGTKCVCFFYGKLEWKNCCYLVFGDKKKRRRKRSVSFSKWVNVKHGWLLHRRPMLHSRRGLSK